MGGARSVRLLTDRRSKIRALTTDPAMYEAGVGLQFQRAAGRAGGGGRRYLTERVVARRRAARRGRRSECERGFVVGTGAGRRGGSRGELGRGRGASRWCCSKRGEYHHREGGLHRPGHRDAAQALPRHGARTISVGNVSIPIPVGKKGVGGDHDHQLGHFAIRAPARIFDSWREKHGLGDLQRRLRWARHYRAVERRCSAWAERGPALTSAASGRRDSRAACDALGFSATKPLRRKRAPRLRRVRACAAFGLPQPTPSDRPT